MGSLWTTMYYKDPILEDCKSGKGPLGLGDPEDLTLRPYELAVHIPAAVHRAIYDDMCTSEKKIVDICYDDSVFPSVFCSEFMKALKDCMASYETTEFREKITGDYVKYRSIYRRTGKRRLFNALQGNDTFPSEEKL